ncbi:hypothetical protein KR200_010470 [Drosophila serrata]|nr:hypothetical protein KR200_010470 [Drosophila serrata]
MLLHTLFSFIIYLILIFKIIPAENSDEDSRKVYSGSILALGDLKQFENSYMDQLNNYIISLQQKVDILRKYDKAKIYQKYKINHIYIRFTDSIKHKNLDNEVSQIEYISNPLNSFQLVRRTHEDWPKWLNYIRDHKNEDNQLSEMHQLLNRTPTAEDLEEASLGMYRIEHFYNLNSMDMSQGLLAGQQLETQMSASDCLALADYMFNKSEYRRAAQWYRLALYNIKEPTNRIALEIYKPNREELRKMFVISRLHEGFLNNISNYLEEVNKDPGIPLPYLKPIPPATAIERGCRGEFPPRPRLVCRYNFTTTPFMRIAPLKEEEISKDPLMWLYHDVLYDSEIAHFINLTSDDLTQGYTDNYTTPKTPERVFQVKVTDDDGCKVDKALVNRMTDISGLAMGNVTSLARANYGLGGYFPEHSDYRDPRIYPEMVKEGDRLLTFVFYATDVPLGGATIFPAANLTIQPKKGSALFWYNLHNNWDPNPLTRHAVCPVILGNRWSEFLYLSLRFTFNYYIFSVFTKSMTNYYQMFTKPCYK